MSDEQSGGRGQALSEFLARARTLSHGAPEVARMERSPWRRALHAFLGRLIRFETAWQHEYNRAATTVLEHLALQGHLADASLTAIRSRQNDLERRLQEMKSALAGQTQELKESREERDKQGELERAWRQAAEEQMDRTTGEVERLRETVEQVEAGSVKAREAVRKRDDRMDGELQRFREEVKRILQAGENVRRSLIDAASRMTRMEKEREAARGDLQELDERLSGTDATQVRLQQEQAQVREAQGNLQEKILDTEKRLQERLARLGEREEALLHKIQDSHARLEDLSSEARQWQQGVRQQIQQVEERLAQEEMSFDVAAFADRFRGHPEEIRRRQMIYIDLFKNMSVNQHGPILDLGPGRGEFLELCREFGLAAEGIERDEEQVASLAGRGLVVRQGDAPACLASIPDGELGALLAVQVIEHLTPGGLQQVIRESFRILGAGGIIVLESLNPACLSVLANTFYRDPSHRRPLHPDTVAFLLEQAGFGNVEVVTHSPVPEAARLGGLPPSAIAHPGLKEELNTRLGKLDHLLYSEQEYHVIGRKV